MQLLMQHPRINLMESLTQVCCMVLRCLADIALTTLMLAQGNKKGMLSFYGGHLISAAADQP